MRCGFSRAGVTCGQRDSTSVEALRSFVQFLLAERPAAMAKGASRIGSSWVVRCRFCTTMAQRIGNFVGYPGQRTRRTRALCSKAIS